MSFSYTASDGAGGNDTAVVTVTVAGANDGPVITEEDLLKITRESIEKMGYRAE